MKNLPIYRYLFEMSRDGFTVEEFVELAINHHEQISEQQCNDYLDMLLKSKILIKRANLYFFRFRNED